MRSDSYIYHTHTDREPNRDIFFARSTYSRTSGTYLRQDDVFVFIRYINQSGLNHTTSNQSILQSLSAVANTVRGQLTSNSMATTFYLTISPLRVDAQKV